MSGQAGYLPVVVVARVLPCSALCVTWPWLSPITAVASFSCMFRFAGVGTVVAGTVMRGCIKVGSTMLLGPDRLGDFQLVTIRSIHVQYTPVEVALPGGSAAFAVRPKGGKAKAGSDKKHKWCASNLFDRLPAQLYVVTCHFCVFALFTPLLPSPSSVPAFVPCMLFSPPGPLQGAEGHEPVRPRPGAHVALAVQRRDPGASPPDHAGGGVRPRDAQRLHQPGGQDHGDSGPGGQAHRCAAHRRQGGHHLQVAVPARVPAPG